MIKINDSKATFHFNKDSSDCVPEFSIEMNINSEGELTTTIERLKCRLDKTQL